MSVLLSRRLTVSDVVVKTGIAYGRLNRLVHGAVAPAPIEVDKLATELGVEKGELFTLRARATGGEDL